MNLIFLLSTILASRFGHAFINNDNGINKLYVLMKDNKNIIKDANDISFQIKCCKDIKFNELLCSKNLQRENSYVDLSDCLRTKPVICPSSKFNIWSTVLDDNDTNFCRLLLKYKDLNANIAVVNIKKMKEYKDTVKDIMDNRLELFLRFIDYLDIFTKCQSIFDKKGAKDIEYYELKLNKLDKLRKLIDKCLKDYFIENTNEIYLEEIKDDKINKIVEVIKKRISEAEQLYDDIVKHIDNTEELNTKENVVEVEHILSEENDKLANKPKNIKETDLQDEFEILGDTYESQEIIKYKKKIIRLQQVIDNIEKEKNKLKTKLATINENGLTNSNDQLGSETKKACLNSELTKEQKSNIELKVELLVWQNTSKILEGKNNELNDTIVSLEGRIKQLVEVNEELRNKIAEHEKDNTPPEGNVNNFTESNTVQKESNDELEKRKVALDIEIMNLNKKKTELNEVIDNLTRRKTALENENNKTTLESENNNLKEEVTKLNEQVSVLTLNMKSVENERNEIKKENDELTKNIKALKDQLMQPILEELKLKGKISELEDKCISLEDSIRDLENNNGLMSVRIRNYENDIKSQKIKINKLTVEKENILIKFIEEEKKTKLLDEANKELKVKVDTFENIKISMENENRKLNNTKNKLSESVDALTKELEAANSTIDQLRKEADSSSNNSNTTNSKDNDDDSTINQLGKDADSRYSSSNSNTNNSKDNDDSGIIILGVIVVVLVLVVLGIVIFTKIQVF